jgi:hypothetical protein
MLDIAIILKATEYGFQVKTIKAYLNILFLRMNLINKK